MDSVEIIIRILGGLIGISFAIIIIYLVMDYDNGTGDA